MPIFLVENLVAKNPYNNRSKIQADNLFLNKAALASSKTKLKIAKIVLNKLDIGKK
jgi:hypothetical protein